MSDSPIGCEFSGFLTYHGHIVETNTKHIIISRCIGPEHCRVSCIQLPIAQQRRSKSLLFSKKKKISTKPNHLQSAQTRPDRNRRFPAGGLRRVPARRRYPVCGLGEVLAPRISWVRVWSLSFFWGHQQKRRESIEGVFEDTKFDSRLMIFPPRFLSTPNTRDRSP